MNTTRVFLASLIAVAIAFGFCSTALAQGPIQWPQGDFKMYQTTRYEPVSPDYVMAGFYQGIVAMTPLPPTGSDMWPCFAGGAACVNAPSGSFIIGQPQQSWPATCHKCGQIFYTFETTNVSGEAKAAVSVTQGEMILLRTALTKIGTVLPNHIVTVQMPTSFGGKPGPATIRTTTKIGSMVIHGQATVYLQ